MSTMNRQDYKKKISGKKKRKRRIITWILVPILVLVVSVSAYATFLYNKAESVMNKSYTPVGREQPTANPLGNTSILFIGVDDSTKRQEGNPRSDALLLATFNKKNHSIKLLSIPRDSYVHIPEKNIYTKITHAHAYGGVKLTIETVQELLGIPVDYYVKMNFNAFIDVVDALGGISVDVPYTFSEQDSHDHAKAITLQKGVQQLNGEQALALARTRHMDSDIYRGQRQQKIFKAILSKATSVKSITSYSNVIEAIGKNMSTDLTFDQLKSLANYVQGGEKLQISSLKLQGSDSMIDGVYYYQLDKTSLENVKTKLKQQLEN